MVNAFGRERPGLCRFLPAALTDVEVDEVDIDVPGFEAWPSAEPWAEAVAALEGYTLEEVAWDEATLRAIFCASMARNHVSPADLVIAWDRGKNGDLSEKEFVSSMRKAFKGHD